MRLLGCFVRSGENGGKTKGNSAQITITKTLLSGSHFTAIDHACNPYFINCTHFYLFIFCCFVVCQVAWENSATLNNVWKTTEKTTAEIPYWSLHYPDVGRAYDWLICLIQSEELTNCGQYQVHLKNFQRPIFNGKKKLFRVFNDTIFTFGVAIILSFDWKKKRLRMFCFVLFFILAQPWQKMCRATMK